jgi:phage terminase small subunit
MSEKITPKQAIFISEYLIHGNGTRAAQAAGVPEKSAHTTASRWLKNPKIAAIIAERHAARAAKMEITAERVLRELARLAYFDAGNLYDAQGERIPLYRLDPNTRAAITAVEDETRQTANATTRVQRIKMADKGQNLERLGKYLHLFGDASFGATVETGSAGLPADSTIKIVLVRPE